MSRRPTLLALSGLLAAALVGVPASARADSHVAVLGPLPAGMTAVQGTCDRQGLPVGEPEPAESSELRRGPGAAPLHDESLEIWADAEHRPGLALDLASSAELANLRFSAYQLFFARVSVRTADGTWHHSAGGRQGTPSGQWTGFDLAGLVADDLGPVTAVIWFGSCNPSRASVSVDALRVGASGDVTTYDFEGGRVRLEAAGSSSEPGARWHAIYCSLRDDTSLDPIAPIGDQPVAFETRMLGDRDFRRVAVVRTADHGQASVRVRPTRTFDFRCVYAGTAGSADPDSPPHEAATSRSARVAVGTHLSVRARRTTHGRRVVVTGRADPARPGSRVVLRGRDGLDGPFVRLGRTTLSRQGTYRFDRRLAPAANRLWTLEVTTPAVPDAGLARGHSSSRYLE